MAAAPAAADSRLSGSIIPLVWRDDDGGTAVNLTFVPCVVPDDNAFRPCLGGTAFDNPYVAFFLRNTTGYVFSIGSDTMNLTKDYASGYEVWAYNYTLPEGDWAGLGYVVSYALIGTFNDHTHYTVSGALNGLDLSFSTPYVNVTDSTTGAVFTAADVVLVTSWDSYVPLLVWGGALVLFLWFNAWLPAIASMMALAASMRDPPIWSHEASVLLVVASLVIHSLVVNGIIPVPFLRRKNA